MATGAAAAASRRWRDIPASALNPATINSQDSDAGRFRRSRVRHTVSAVGELSSAAGPRRQRRRRRHGAHDKMAQAGRRGPDFHPAQPAAGAHRRQLSRSHSPAGPRVGGDQRHQGERRRLVRVLGGVSSTHRRLQPEWHLGLPGRHRSVLSRKRDGWESWSQWVSE